MSTAGESVAIQGSSNADDKNVLEHLVSFSRALIDAGVTVNSSNLIDLCRSFQHIHLSSKQHFYNTARAILVSRQADYDRFHLEFIKYWEGFQLPSGKKNSNEGDNDDPSGDDQSQEQERSTANRSEEGNEQPACEISPEQSSCSGDELLMKKDLTSLDTHEIGRAREIVRQLAAALATRTSRRKKPATRGSDIAFRRLLRDNLNYDGDIIKLKYRRQRQKKTQVLLLCDVSGSMDKYSSFLIQLIYAMQHEIPNFEVAVFSTRISVITPYLKGDNVAEVLADVSDHVHDWAGGTNIGGCIKEFNQQFSQHMSQSKTVMIVLSDGWDRGDGEIMRSEMASLRRRTDKLIWLNPLLSNPEYKPLVKGMRTALPYLDHFLPVHNLESLVRLIEILRACRNS